MKLQFDPEQPHQLEPIQNIIDLLRGYLPEHTVSKNKDSKAISNFWEEGDLDPVLLTNNLNSIQAKYSNQPGFSSLGKNNPIDIDDGPTLNFEGIRNWAYPYFIIEMETGTGKTYTYLRSILELNKHYGFCKFLIITPNIAVYECVKNFYNVAIPHLQNLYEGKSFRITPFLDTDIQIIKEIAISPEIEILLLPISSFGKVNSGIYKPSDSFKDDLPIHWIQQMRPILILDDLNGNQLENYKPALRTLKPLIAFYFTSAPPKKIIEYFGSKTIMVNNHLYRLSPIESLQKKLLKKIKVIGKQELKIDPNITLKEIFRIQIRETISQHIELQNRLESKGIKVLSLFFIDRVKHFIHEKEGYIRQIFDEEFYNLKVNSNFLKELEPEQVRTHYFAYHKEFIDTDLKKEEDKKSKEHRNAEKQVYTLIANDKEKLLSLEEPISFLFSHTALKEAWENPNLFYICLLNEFYYDDKKRQEVSRGIRLCINQKGEVVKEESSNILTIITTETYQEYCSQWKSDYKREIEEVPLEPNQEKKEGKRNEELFQSKDFKLFWNSINQNAKLSFINIDPEDIIDKCTQQLNETNLSKTQSKYIKSKYSWDEYQISIKKIAENKNPRDNRVGVVLSISSKKNFEATKVTVWEGSDLMLITKDENLRGFVVSKISKGKKDIIIEFHNEFSLSKTNPIYFTTQKELNPNKRIASKNVILKTISDFINRVSKETKLAPAIIEQIIFGIEEQQKKIILQNLDYNYFLFSNIINNNISELSLENTGFKLSNSHLFESIEEVFPEFIEYAQTILVEGGKNSLYSKIPIDFETEEKFVNILNLDPKVSLYFKIPTHFQSKLPSFIGFYFSLWGIIYLDDFNNKSFILANLVNKDFFNKNNQNTSKVIVENYSNEKKVVYTNKYFDSIGLDYRIIIDPTKNWLQQELGIKEQNKKRIKFLKNVNKKKYITALPVYSFEGICQKLGRAKEVKEEGWVEVNNKINDKMFVIPFTGHSMEDEILDGDYIICEQYVSGILKNKIVLVEHTFWRDEETNSHFSIKKYTSTKKVSADWGWEYESILLSPINKDFESIAIDPESQESEPIRILALVVGKLSV